MRTERQLPRGGRAALIRLIGPRELPLEGPPGSASTSYRTKIVKMILDNSHSDRKVSILLMNVGRVQETGWFGTGSNRRNGPKSTATIQLES